eukprot:CAMPEP_0172590506 /NCGR_PEP_ID=MMETSP1068-20121228/9028_1 /TAXON_ID=35684 /ORGANISM="Pseudopedinella elastica, Strain CCMP716" /LENGTH=253 /DNA_ID=CAMNT_0013386413 /DNA_START=158 /DNA_END=919 /DNA_ORIENTATION=-
MEAQQAEGILKDAERTRTERSQMSREALVELSSHVRATNFRGENAALAEIHLRPNYVPVGTGDCCATKLIALAAAQGLRPKGIAEFFLGKRTRAGTRVEDSKFYDSCEARCQPVLGFMLCGLESSDATKNGELNRGASSIPSLGVIQNEREAGLALVRVNGFAMQRLSEALRDDPELARVAVSQCGYALRWASDRLRADPEIVSLAVSQSAGALRYASRELRNDPEVLVNFIKLGTTERVAEKRRASPKRMPP